MKRRRSGDHLASGERKGSEAIVPGAIDVCKSLELGLERGGKDLGRGGGEEARRRGGGEARGEGDQGGR